MIAKTILIGLHGVTFSIFNLLMKQGIMPSLKEYIASGVSSSLLPTEPTINPTTWVSLTTGRSPEYHGIMGFTQLEFPESQHLRVNTSSSVGCETIWSMISRNGLKAASLNFPLMAPPIPINGYIIPGWIVWRYMRYGCYPSDLYDRLKALPFFNIKELATDVEKTIENSSEEEWDDLIKLHIRRERQWFEILHHKMTQEPCNFTGVIFDGISQLLTLFWKLFHPDYLSEDHSPTEEKARELCIEYFSLLDSFIAEIIVLAGSDARIFFASSPGADHPEGIFIALGPGIRKGISIDPISVLDVTPMLLHSLGIPIPEDLEGRIPDTIFDSDFIKGNPIKLGPPAIKSDISSTPFKLQQDEDAQQKVLQRLKKLGYIE
jgi:predicted AlkP superfamily phosphohydrolase/phosphomutase